MRGFPPAEKIICHPGVDTAASWQRLSHFKGISQNLHVMRMGGLLLLDDFFGVILLVICVFSPGSLNKNTTCLFSGTQPKTPWEV